MHGFEAGAMEVDFVTETDEQRQDQEEDGANNPCEKLRCRLHVLTYSWLTLMQHRFKLQSTQPRAGHNYRQNQQRPRDPRLGNQHNSASGQNSQQQPDPQLSVEHLANTLVIEVVTQLHSCLIKYLDLDGVESNWEPRVLTESLVVFLFTLNQDVKLAKTSHIVNDSRIFPILLNVYLNTLLLQSHHQGHFHN